MILPVVLSSFLCVVVAAPSRPIVVADLPPGPQIVYDAPAVVHSAPAVVHSAPAVVHSAPAVVHSAPAVVHSAPAVVHSAPAVVHSAPVVAAPVAVVSSQSHAQDELGQYSYSYSNPLSAKVETKSIDGVTRGGYSYLDSHGLVQSVNYVSDDVNGFRVAASNLPLGPVTPQEDEPHVAVEKAKAVAALQEAAVKDAAEAAIAYENEVASGPIPAVPVAPVVHEAPVPSTPAPPAYVSPAIYSTVAPDLHVTPAPVPVVSHAPEAPVVHVTPAPHRVISSAPIDHSPSAQLVVSPTPHSYATVELDTYDIPAPAPEPGAYFQPSAAVIAHSPVVVTPAPPVVAVEHASPVVPVVHASPAPVVYEAAPVVHEAPAPAPVVAAAPAVVHSAPVVAAPVAVVSSQSHAQDELGQYSYSYSNPLSAKVETKSIDGVTRGGYSYVDSHGLVQNVNYVSDDLNGFRVAASNLPAAAVPVEIPDSEDIAAAKQVFFAEIARAKAAAAHAH